MKQFSAEQIQDAFEKLSPEIQQAVNSPEVHNSIEILAKKHGLHVDQLGELVDTIGLVMLGLIPSRDFVRTFAKEAQVDEKVARDVATDVNKEIFDAIKESMRVVEENIQSGEGGVSINNHTPSISAIEKAGGFSIEPGNGYKNSVDDNKVGSSDREKILSQVEYPPTTRVATNPEREVHTEPLVDHLLANHVGSVMEKVVYKEEATSTLPPIKDEIKKETVENNTKKNPDPYKELI